jgi:hypothetical protein
MTRSSQWQRTVDKWIYIEVIDVSRNKWTVFGTNVVETSNPRYRLQNPLPKIISSNPSGGHRADSSDFHATALHTFSSRSDGQQLIQAIYSCAAGNTKEIVVPFPNVDSSVNVAP